MHVGKKMAARSVALILAAVVAFPVIPQMSGKKSVYADAPEKSMSNTRYGVNGISAPLRPESKDAPWKGSYVWFGHYGSEPVKFRVLSPKTTKYGEETLFLDCDRGLFDAKMGSFQVKWEKSDLRTTLNSTFLDLFVFDPERNAIARSKYAGGVEYSYDSFEYEAYDRTVALDDKVFLLDADDVLNPEYGYYADHGWETDTDWEHCTRNHSVLNHRKKNSDGNNARWWIRSYSTWHNGIGGIVDNSGVMSILEQNYQSTVAPALNVSLKSVLFSTEVKAAGADGSGAEYKLTLLDRDIKIKVPGNRKAEHTGRTVSVPYTSTGPVSPNRISVLILDRPYSPGNTNGAKMLSYQELDGAPGKSGTGAFTLPSDLSIDNWGKKYFVYMVGECNSSRSDISDYASTPVEIYIDNSVRFDFVTSDIERDTIHDDALDVLVNKGLITRRESSGSMYWYDVDCDGSADFYVKEGLDFYVHIAKAPIKGTYVFSEEQLLGTGFTSIAFIFTVEKPGTITGLKAVSAGKNQVKLTWNPVEGVEGYLIYAQKDGKYGYVGMTTKGTSFTDTKALDTDYNYYWVFGYNRDYYGNMIAGGCEKYVYAKGVCLAVTGLKASSVTGGVKLTWNASAGAEGYLVYGIHPGGSYGYIGMTTQGTTFTDKKASKTDWNFYWVFPYHKNGSTMVVGGTPKYVYGKAK